MKILVLTYPTFDDDKTLMINARKDLLCPATDGIVSELLKLGHTAICVNLAAENHSYTKEELDCPGFISGLRYLKWQEVQSRNFDVIWHAIKDPTPNTSFELVRKVMGEFSGSIPVINSVDAMRDFSKKKYLPALNERKIGVKICNGTHTWSDVEKANPSREGNYITKDHKYVRTWVTNSTRGELFNDDIGITLEFVDTTKLESSKGFRTFFRVPYCEGKCLKGFKYYCPPEIMCPKTGAAKEIEDYEVPEGESILIGLVMKELGVNLAHVEGFEKDAQRKVAIFDVNPFPSSAGRTLTPMAKQIAQRLEQAYAV